VFYLQYECLTTTLFSSVVLPNDKCFIINNFLLFFLRMIVRIYIHTYYICKHTYIHYIYKDILEIVKKLGDL
jgi:hypothetical protein